jgi:molecular chaperone HscC
VADNILLGRIEAPIPAGPAGSVQIEIRFSYDINGLLEVDVHIPKTGEKRELVIADEAVMADADFEKRRLALAALKQHPRDSDANKAAMARANRCYEESLGEQRAFIGDQIREFESVLDRQDPRDIEYARTKLTQVLDRFEGETWL